MVADALLKAEAQQAQEQAAADAAKAAYEEEMARVSIDICFLTESCLASVKETVAGRAATAWPAHVACTCLCGHTCNMFATSASAHCAGQGACGICLAQCLHCEVLLCL